MPEMKKDMMRRMSARWASMFLSRNLVMVVLVLEGFDEVSLLWWPFGSRACRSAASSLEPRPLKRAISLRNHRYACLHYKEKWWTFLMYVCSGLSSRRHDSSANKESRQTQSRPHPCATNTPPSTIHREISRHPHRDGTHELYNVLVDDSSRRFLHELWFPTSHEASVISVISVTGQRR